MNLERLGMIVFIGGSIMVGLGMASWIVFGPQDLFVITGLLGASIAIVGALLIPVIPEEE